MTADRDANLPAWHPQPLRLHFQTIPTEADGSALFDNLFAGSPNAVWLDSPGASTSVLCDDSGPFSHSLFIDANTTAASNNAFDQAQELLDIYTVEIPPELPCDFALGLVGAFGYELKTHAGATCTAQSPSPHPEPLPDLALIYTDRAVVIDHKNQQTHVLYLLPVENEYHELQNAWLRRVTDAIEARPATTGANPSAAQNSSPPIPAPKFTLDQSKFEYLESIARCLDYIAAGDSYEICLTNTAQGPSMAEIGLEPINAYSALRRTSPVPYGAYLQFTPRQAGYVPFQLLSASPEQFLKITNGHVTAQPIKGTRPRGRNAEEDAAWRRELKTNPKDRAENLMIVDLLRNDLGRVCQPGTIRVPRIFAVETYSHVHQLVSTIEGHLAPGVTTLKCVAACFPGGSMTGAPKLRTMEIIDELEKRPRGFYSGAVGWVSPNGSADLSIVIRTLVCSPNATTFGVGGAIVWDSDPEGEFAETMVKARALLEALGADIEDKPTS